jgi:formimidoylglutamate deiminase
MSTCLAVDADGRLLEADGRATDAIDAFDDADAFVVPGFVNAHSHAFQRALRGRVERRSKANPQDDFWAWREAMYGDANAVDVDDMEALAAWAYLDMARAGFVAVGEFHYVHADVGGDRLAMARALVRAARQVGLRLVLLPTAYARAGFEKPAHAGQARFVFASSDAFLRHVDDTRALAGDGVDVGVALHSVRACPADWIFAVASYARAHGLPLHVHACEQRRELDECAAEHGCSPIELLERCGALSSSTTLIHATHLDDDDVRRIAEAGASVCVTPSTERNLGDGLCRIADLHAAGVPLCIGTDSHARIDVVDELRSLEDHERLRLQRRNVLVAPGGRLAQALLPAGTRNGRRALGLADDDGERVTVQMPLEGQAGHPAHGVDAWLVGGSSRDVVVVKRSGCVIAARPDDPSHAGLAARDAAIERRALAVLRRLQDRA